MNASTEKRRHQREPYNADIEFIVLFMDEDDFKRVNSKGKILDVSQSGIGISTDFPLEPGHVLQWDDQHTKGKLHMALVKWSEQMQNFYRAGLMFV